MKEEGIRFKTKSYVGRDIKAKELLETFDAVYLAIGSEVPRDLQIAGRECSGIHLALDYLGQQNRILEGIRIPEKKLISAKGKNVLVIGGGDTGSDCVGTANRQGAKSVTQIEILSRPPVEFNPATPWPMYPQVLKTSSSHEEGCIRRWNLTTNKFISDSKGNIKAVEIEEVAWIQSGDGRRPEMKRTGKKETLDTDERKNISVDQNHQTSLKKVFACGDAVSGAGLVVRAMDSGRKTAAAIDNFLKNNH